MKVRTILVVASVAALGGYALYDYYSPDSRRARELHIVETLKPDVKPQAGISFLLTPMDAPGLSVRPPRRPG